jgi:hypothetical protein
MEVEQSSSDIQDKTVDTGYTPDWRASLHTTQERHLYMLQHGNHSDCTFMVGPENGDTQEFKVHRWPLSTASAVFEVMFYGTMSEAATGNVRVTDLTPKTFQLLLR